MLTLKAHHQETEELGLEAHLGVSSGTAVSGQKGNRDGAGQVNNGQGCSRMGACAPGLNKHRSPWSRFACLRAQQSSILGYLKADRLTLPAAGGGGGGDGGASGPTEAEARLSEASETGPVTGLLSRGWDGSHPGDR